MRYNFKNIFNNRKNLHLVLSIVLVSVFSLTIAYSALNTVLKINGNAEVVASSWDIHLDNVNVRSDSVDGDIPKITNKTTATFSTRLEKPGDFYEFTIDVVNDGSIDAMIDSIEKTPTLTVQQAKYLNYIVEYENGKSISTKQLVSSKSFVRLKVRVEFKKDLTASDLPKQTESLSLSFTVKYVQSNGNSENVTIDNNGKLIKVISGDGTKTSDEVCIGNECFYVISSTDTTITMLSKYNLLVGNRYDDTNGAVGLENPTGIQDESAKGWFSSNNAANPLIGTIPFSSTNYWISTTSTYPSYVYNENSYLYEYIENYKSNLEGLGAEINEARLITIEELEGLGCSIISKSCSGAPSWVYSTTYWSGTSNSSTNTWIVDSASNFYNCNYTYNIYGVRPVIIISKSFF